MAWKTSINDVKVICKKCNIEMIVESTRNDIQALLCCPLCFDNVHIKIFHKQELPEKKVLRGD